MSTKKHTSTCLPNRCTPNVNNRISPRTHKPKIHHINRYPSSPRRVLFNISKGKSNQQQQKLNKLLSISVQRELVVRKRSSNPSTRVHRTLRRNSFFTFSSCSGVQKQRAAAEIRTRSTSFSSRRNHSAGQGVFYA